MADKIKTDTQNQRLYLENLAKSGDTGQQAWANDQLANFDSNYTNNNGIDGASNAQNNTSMNDIMGMLGMMSNAYLQQQQGALDSARQNQIVSLEKAYSDAVAQGRLSVRDAEQQFNEQTQAINQAAYQDAERTKIYGQNMGLQNSQQMQGLMQGDNARKNSLINQNITTRDKRISDIRDRINAITTQRDLDIANVNTQYDAGMQQAMGTAMMNMGNNMFNVMQGDYTSNRDHQRALELSDVEYERTKEMMSEEQRFALEKMEKENGYAITRTRFAAELEKEMREEMEKSELERLFRAYGINPNDPNALALLRKRQNAEPAITEVDTAAAFSELPTMPAPAGDFGRFASMLNPFSSKEYVSYNGNVYNKDELTNYQNQYDSIMRKRKEIGLD